MSKRKIVAPPVVPLDTRSEAEKLHDAIVTLLEDWNTLRGWIDQPTPDLAGNALRAVDRGLLDDVTRSAERVRDLLPDVALDAVEEAADGVACAACDEIDKLLAAVLKLVEDDGVAATIEAAFSTTTDRIRTIAEEWEPS
jgi:hypothetical protein